MFDITILYINFLFRVTEDECKTIEKATRKQSQCNEWFHHRRWRLTASRFGDIIKMTHRRNKTKLCKSLNCHNKIVSKFLVHGKQFECKGLCKFETQKNVKCHPVGLFIRPDFPFLGASPDGITDTDYLVEVKCPYSGRNIKVLPGKFFPFLHTITSIFQNLPVSAILVFYQYFPESSSICNTGITSISQNLPVSTILIFCQ